MRESPKEFANRFWNIRKPSTETLPDMIEARDRETLKEAADRFCTGCNEGPYPKCKSKSKCGSRNAIMGGKEGE